MVNDRMGTVPGGAAQAATAGREVALRRARSLNRLTIAWNAVEGMVALVAGIAAGSISLLAFGLDSGIEVSAALAFTWRLGREGRVDCTLPSDRVATRLVALSFAALAIYVIFEGTGDLIRGTEPDVSPVGIVLATLALAFGPWLARAKARLAPALGSQAAATEARQTALCAYLAGVLLLGLTLNAGLSWWWADPLAAIGIGLLAGVESVRAWRAETLADTCCA